MSLKIYFAGSITGGREDLPIYKAIDEKLKKYGTVLSPFVSDESLDQTGMQINSLHDTFYMYLSIEIVAGEKRPAKEIHDEDVKLLEESSGE